MIDRLTLDANVLIYSIDQRDPAKHALANLIAGSCSRANCRLPLQCLGEFCAAVMKKSMLPMTEINRIIRLWRTTMRLIPPEPDDLPQALDLVHLARLQFYDALLLTAAKRSGCSLLLSEDMQHTRDYGGITVLNPFLLPAAELDHLLA